MENICVVWLGIILLPKTFIQCCAIDMLLRYDIAMSRLYLYVTLIINF